MKYKEKLSERIKEETKYVLSAKNLKSDTITKDQLRIIDEIDSLTCEMCQGLNIISNIKYDPNIKGFIVELGNNKGDILLLQTRHEYEYDTVEIKCVDTREYYICPFSAIYRIQIPLPYGKTYELEELRIPYGNDVIVYKDGIPKIYIYTDVKNRKDLLYNTNNEGTERQLQPDYTIELCDRLGEQKEIIIDGHKQPVITYLVSNINGEPVHFPYDNVCYIPGFFKENASQAKERLCIEVANKFLPELIPERGKTRVRTKNNKLNNL